MGGANIADGDLERIGVQVVEKGSDGDRKLEMSSSKVDDYVYLVGKNLESGFWNEVVGDEITFIFKYRDGSTRKYELSTENESEVAELCSKFSGDSLEKTKNVYKYLSENKFYRDFMKRNYADLVNR